MGFGAILSAIVAVIGLATSLIHYLTTRNDARTAAAIQSAKEQSDASTIEREMVSDVLASGGGAVDKLRGGTF